MVITDIYGQEMRKEGKSFQMHRFPDELEKETASALLWQLDKSQAG